jgi:hypothetical protein
VLGLAFVAAEVGDLAQSRFLYVLGCTGLAALIVMAFPVTAVFGLFLGILPGLVLGWTPSLFIYLLAWGALRWLVLKLGTVAGLNSSLRQTPNLVPVAILMVLAFAIPGMINAPHEREMAQLQANDVESSAVIKLPATVAIELPSSSHMGRRGEGPFCEALCLRLLYNGVVSRVIAVARHPDGAMDLASYRIERREQCPKADLPRSLIVWPRQHLEMGTGPKRVEGRVEARAAAGECLVREAGRIADAGMVIAISSIKAGTSAFRAPWSLWLDTVGAKRLEIVEADGRVLYRRTQIDAELLSAPLRSTAGGGLLTTVTYVGWAYRVVHIQPLGPDGRDILPALLGKEASRPPDVPDTVRSVQ